jgi:uncharacterized membrane protein
VALASGAALLGVLGTALIVSLVAKMVTREFRYARMLKYIAAGGITRVAYSALSAPVFGNFGSYAGEAWAATAFSFILWASLLYLILGAMTEAPAAGQRRRLATIACAVSLAFTALFTFSRLYLFQVKFYGRVYYPLRALPREATPLDGLDELFRKSAERVDELRKDGKDESE